MHESNLTAGLRCHHCGKECNESVILSEDRIYCCHGCKGIHEILSMYIESDEYKSGDNVKDLTDAQEKGKSIPDIDVKSKITITI